MIRKLRQRFIITATLSLLAVMTVLICTLNLINYIQTENKINAMLSLLASSGGELPEFKDPQWYPDGVKDYTQKSGEGTETLSQVTQSDKKTLPGDSQFDSGQIPQGGKQQTDGIKITPETKYQTRFFIVDISAAGDVESVDLRQIAAVTKDDASSYAIEALSRKGDSGWVGIYKYLITGDASGQRIIFLDCSFEIEGRTKLLFTSLVVALSSLVAVFLLITVISGRAIKPISENYKKQKQFITDASHEIKTPLAIISANAEVMEMTSGSNEWLTSIKNQTERLNKLVSQLIMLAKMEEEQPSLQMASFNISDAVYDTAAPFETLAKYAGKEFALSVEPGLTYKGDEGEIRQLTSILCDNAVKYSDEKGRIHVTLGQKGRNIVLEVFNTCQHIDSETMKHLFDRFYRADTSRSRKTGGDGIGLSIVKAITEAHKGKITVRTDDGNSILFTAVFKT